MSRPKRRDERQDVTCVMSRRTCEFTIDEIADHLLRRCQTLAQHIGRDGDDALSQQMELSQLLW